jgi:toxin ParE1/3/4
MNVILLPPSDTELQDAIDFYDDQMDGLGDRFYQSFLKTIRHIEAEPELWRKVGENTRRINISRFPYLILYVQHHEDILVTCIAHQHRDPPYYMNRTA